MSDGPDTSSNSPFSGIGIVIALALLAAVGLTFLINQELVQQRPVLGGLEPGNPLPQIKAAGWVNGDAPTEESLQGKVVVVEAWATWCLPCRQKMPELVETYKRYEDRDVVFIGLTSESEDSLPQIEAFIEELEIPWVNGYGAVDTLVALNANAIPQAWVAGPDGIIVWNTDSPGKLEDGIDQALTQIK